MNYDELARAYASQTGAPIKLRSWASIYLTTIRFLMEGHFRGNLMGPKWQDFVHARNFLLVQLGHQGLSVNEVIKKKEDNAVKSCSQQFVRHIPDAEIVYMLVKTLDDSLPFEEAVANFLIFFEAYTEMKGIVVKNDGTFEYQLIPGKKSPEMEGVVQ